jgi:hypothetical protein
MFELIVRRHPYAEFNGDLKQYLADLKDGPLRIPSNYMSLYSLKMQPLLEIVTKMVSKSETSRISFEDIWEIVCKN